MKKYILIFFIFISACNKQETPTDGGDAVSTQQDSVVLPEPSVEEQNLARFKLTELAAVPEKFFKLNDNIVFTGLDEQIKSKQFLKEVELKIKSHCILEGEQVLIRDSTRSLSQSIPIIELLPTEALSQGEVYPSCGFSFKAEHKSGSAHHFELPPLPIIDHEESRFIQIINSLDSQTVSDLFPYILMKHINHYFIDIGEKELMDNLKLICKDFSLNRSIRPQQFIPLSVFPFSDLTEEEKEKVQNKNLQQKCRVFGYRDNTLVGVSSVFHIFYPQEPLYLSIDDDVLSDDEKSLFYYKIMDENGEIKEKRGDITVYSYKIHNPHPYPVYILIENYKERDLHLDFYGLYYRHKRGDEGDGKSFYVVHEDPFRLSTIETTEGTTFYRQNKQGTLITLKPNSAIKTDVVLKSRFEFELCSISNSMRYLGGVLPYPDLKIYQVISDKIDLIPLEKNILHQLNNRSGKSLLLLTKELINNFNKNHKKNLDDSRNKRINHLWFRKGLCSGKIVAEAPDPVIELYRNGNSSYMRIRIIDSTPVNQNNYDETNRILEYKYIYSHMIRGV